MIVLVHDFLRVTAVRGTAEDVSHFVGRTATSALLEAAARYPETTIGWVHERLVDAAAFAAWETLLYHGMELISWEPGPDAFVGEAVEYIDFASPFVMPRKMRGVRYGTWMVSAAMGAAKGSLLSRFSALDKVDDFSLFLVLAARSGLRRGVLSYCEPAMCSPGGDVGAYRGRRMDGSTFLTFVRSFYGMKQVLFYLALRGKKASYGVWDLPGSKRFRAAAPGFEAVQAGVEKAAAGAEDTIDVIIPTLGRKSYLADVLADLAAQTHPPAAVIIVEQNPETGSHSELDDLLTAAWPFAVRHTFIRQTGACNARNIAIAQAKAKYVFFADDDLRLEPQTLQNALETMKSFHLGACTLGVYQPDERPVIQAYPRLWHTFGSGCSIVESRFVRGTFFDPALDGGYGEDKDYGFALREKGCTIGFVSRDPILHLKAPSGGFRFKSVLPWAGENPSPKPSPTVMYYLQKHHTPRQIAGYRFYHYLHRVIAEKAFNLPAFNRKFRLQWEKSLAWAAKLQKGGAE